MSQAEPERQMTDPNEVATACIEVWNERDKTRRDALMASRWSEGASYVDPLMQGKGRTEIAALIGAVQERFPDFRFSLLGKPDGFGTNVRFSWGLGPEGADAPIKGTDFVALDNGRLHGVVGFFDQFSAA
jgi:hypothetical protein